MLIIVPDETAVLEVTRTAGRYYVTVQGPLPMSATCEPATMAASPLPEATNGRPAFEAKPPAVRWSRRKLPAFCVVGAAIMLVGAIITVRSHGDSHASASTPDLADLGALPAGVPHDPLAPEGRRDRETARLADELRADQQRPELPKPRIVPSPDAAHARNAAFGLE